jgi:hypothetical protein
LRTRSRIRLFVGLAVVCGVAIVALAAATVLRATQGRAAADRAVSEDRPQARQILSGGDPFAVLRSVDRSHPATYGRVEVASLHGRTPGRPALAGPACQRVAFAAGRGICLDVLGTETSVEVMDARLRVLHRFNVPGVPSRARVSPDGRWGGVTTFVVGHAYAKPGQFSTATTLVDMRTGKPAGDLERDFRFTHDGAVVDARSRNYWGLTFAGDGDTFYATLSFGGHSYLVRGSISARSGRTIHDNVECPSLSPDGTRIGYKKVIAHDPTVWRFHVLDLATGRETALAETRSVDDQLAWVDDQHLVYGDGERVWMVNADGSGRPQVWMGGADSPTVDVPRTDIAAAGGQPAHG